MREMNRTGRHVRVLDSGRREGRRKKVLSDKGSGGEAGKEGRGKKEAI